MGCPGGGCYARIITSISFHIQHNLKMQVGWPVAILLGPAQAGKMCSGLNGLAFCKPLQGLSAQVPVKGIKGTIFQLMLQNKGGSVIAKARIVSKAVYGAGQGGVQGRFGGQPDIYTQVQAAGLFAGIVAGLPYNRLCRQRPAGGCIPV
jgi:hypothetical protein